MFVFSVIIAAFMLCFSCIRVRLLVVLIDVMMIYVTVIPQHYWFYVLLFLQPVRGQSALGWFINNNNNNNNVN